MPQHLLIVGASVRAAAWSAVQAGFQVSAADRFADADLRRLCAHVVLLDDWRALTTSIDSIPSRSGTPQAWLYTGGLENRPALVRRLAARLPLLGNDAPALERVRRPDFFSDVCRQAGLDVPHWQTTSRGLPRDGSWLQKNLAASGGFHIRPWRGQADVSLPCDRFASTSTSAGPTAANSTTPPRSVPAGNAPPSPAIPTPSATAAPIPVVLPAADSSTGPPDIEPTATWIYQRRINGLPASALYVAAGGRSVFLAASEQWIGSRHGAPHPYAYVGSIGPLPLRPAVVCQLHRLGNALAERAGLKGLFGVDFILQHQTVWPLEINPRFTASAEILEPFLPESAVALHVAACCHGRLPDDHEIPTAPAARNPSAASTDWCAKRIVYATFPLRILPHHTETMLAWRDSHGPLPPLADIPPPGSRIPAGAPIATLLARGPSRAQTERAIRQQLLRLHALLRSARTE